ncbi:MAG: DNA translocase FtsK 4TM domain-containing protein [Candidatus Accumulibacter sp.]|nr:DNA translocase FtsK 4TM domain-containing protein [Accumulibacter sp.]
MPRGKFPGASKDAPNSSGALPEKVASVLQEARWLIVFALGAFLALALLGYSPEDPGWSHAVREAMPRNPAGSAGAWIADLLLFVFGLSAWWWVLFCFAMFWWGYRRLDALRQVERRPFYFSFAGFIVLLVASCGIEALRFYSHSLRLPSSPGPGGLIGVEVGQVAVRFLGYTGATLILLAAMAIGWSLFSGMSWVAFCERLGTLAEFSFFRIKSLVERWQDERIGRETARERGVVVEDEKRRMGTHEPIFIEKVEPVLHPSPKIEKRIERERQTPLFPEAVVGGLLPPLHLLDAVDAQGSEVTPESLEYTSRLIERKLADFGVQVKVLAAYPGPVITRYEVEPAVGVKGSQVVNLATDVARALSMTSIRVVEIVPGKSCMALELPNPKRQIVRLSEIIESGAYGNTSAPLTMTLGKDISGQPVVVDLAKMPHLLVAGTTGSGKSVGINAMILSLLYKSEPDSVRLILVDPKMLELSVYEGIPHLLAPVVVDMKQAANALSWCIGEMEKRYKLMSALGVRNIAGLNARIRDGVKNDEKVMNPLSLTPEAPEPLELMPYIVVVIDELADLMMVAGKKVEQLIARLAQKARASGIHLILATQRPSVDVITGLIKANIPTRISFQVSSKIDSRTILDQMGAEALLGQGDMLYLAPGAGYPTRVHGAFVDDDEVRRVVDYLKRVGAPNYVDGVLMNGDAGDDDDGGASGGDAEGFDAETDPLYDQAVEVVLKNRRASISLVQRHLRIGYNRSARMIEAMEKAGIVSAMDNRGGREVLAPAPAPKDAQ